MNRKMNLRIYFDNHQDKLPLTYRLKMLVREAIEATLDYEQYGNPCEVSVSFVDNAEIRDLNKKFRGIDKATDVLSFPLFDYEGESEEPPVDATACSPWSRPLCKQRSTVTALSVRSHSSPCTPCCIFWATITKRARRTKRICAAVKVPLWI